MAAAKAKQAEAERDDAPDDETEQPAAKPKRKLPLKMIIIAAAGLLVLGGGGAAGYLFLGHSSHDAPAQAAVKPAIFVDLPDVLVNLSNAGTDRTQYLKVKIVLELPDPNVVGQIQPLMPRVMDAFQTYLRELRPTDLDGSAGLYRLKEELTRRVNAAVAPNRITAVLFKEIVVQ
jgi:flagellar FliL protein